MLKPICLLALTAILTGGCLTGGDYVRVDVENGQFEDLWNQFVRIAQTNGCMPNPSETDRGQRVYVSAWIENPAPFGKGFRTRLHARFNRPEDQTKGWVLEFYVQRQIVDDFANSWEPAEDDWSDEGQDVQRQRILLAQTRLAYGLELGMKADYRGDIENLNK